MGGKTREKDEGKQRGNRYRKKIGEHRVEQEGGTR